MNLWLGCWKGAKCKITTSFRPTSCRGLSFFFFYCFSKIWIFGNIHKAVPFLLYSYIAQCISHHLSVNLRTYRGVGGRGVQPTLWGFFLSFHLDEKTTASDASNSCSFIPRSHSDDQFLWFRDMTSQVAGVKMNVFSTSLVNEIMQSAYLCVIYMSSTKKSPFIAV